MQGHLQDKRAWPLPLTSHSVLLSRRPPLLPSTRSSSLHRSRPQRRPLLASNWRRTLQPRLAGWQNKFARPVSRCRLKPPGKKACGGSHVRLNVCCVQVSLQLSASEALQEARREAAAAVSSLAEAVAKEGVLEGPAAEAAGSSHAAVVDVEAQGLREAGADAASGEEAGGQPEGIGVGMVPAPAAAEQSEAEVLKADGSVEEASPDSSKRRTPRPWAVPERQAAPAPSWVLQVRLASSSQLGSQGLCPPYQRLCHLRQFSSAAVLPVSLPCESIPTMMPFPHCRAAGSLCSPHLRPRQPLRSCLSCSLLPPRLRPSASSGTISKAPSL